MDPIPLRTALRGGAREGRHAPVKRLVVNADDLGADPARNAGIFAAVRGGAVTSVSVLVNGPAFEASREELAALCRRGLSVGLHLNLSEGRPLASGLRRLVGVDRAFLGKWAAHARLEDGEDAELAREVSRETEAQLGALVAAGLSPDHLDGHQHVHLYPAVLPLALEAARCAGIRWFRVPDQHLALERQASGLPPGAARFATLAARARPAVEAAGLRCADHFRGLDLVGRLDQETLHHVVAALDEGVTELMVHPGHAGPDVGPFSRFSSPARDTERLDLLRPGFRRALARAGAVLGPFPGEDD
ncbi:MAG: ChbG/HpnK family deacetylase [Deferrisomatales bacterium]|nr:ChbG/HpnK family deacetylase [Deferrisomatales bacterium]